MELKAISLGGQRSGMLNAIKIDDTLVFATEYGNRVPQGFPEGIKVKAVSTGISHSIAIKEDDTIVQWGSSEMEQTKGFPAGVKVKAISTAGVHSIAIKEDDTIVQWGNDGYNLKKDFPEGIKVKAISAGPTHSIAIKEDDTIIQWGNDDNGIKDDFPAGIKVKAISAGFLHSIAIKEDDTIIQWGNDQLDQRKNFPAGIKVKAISAGNTESIAIKEDDTIIQWGKISSNNERLFPTGIKVKAISSKKDSTVFAAIKDNNKLLYWGKDLHVDPESSLSNLAGLAPPPSPPSPRESYVLVHDPFQELADDSRPDVLDPNPYPIYLEEVVVGDLPVKTATYNNETAAYDQLLASETTIVEGLADPDKPLIVKVGPTYSLVYQDPLLTGIDDGSLIKYGCKKTLGLAVYPTNVYGKNPFVYLTGLSSGNFLVLLEEARKVIKKDDIRAIELTPSDIEFATTASFNSIMKPRTLENYLGRRVNLVGADHCQAGSKQRVYKINILNLQKVDGGKRRRTYRKKNLRKITRKQRKQKKSKKSTRKTK